MATVLLGLFGNGMVDAFTVAKRPFRSPILEWKGNGRLYVEAEWAQHNQTGPKTEATPNTGEPF